MKLSHSWSHIQKNLFPLLESELDLLTPTQKHFAALLDLIEIERHIPTPWWRGRPTKNRVALARAFVAKSFFHHLTTRVLIDQLRMIPNLRRLCGWERAAQIPSEATFSRAFDEFAALDLPHRVHEALIRQYQSERLVGHLSRDATDIHAREKPVPKPPKPAPVKAPGKRGRLSKGEVRPPKAPKVLELQPSMSLEEMLAGLPRACDWGAKRKTGGVHYWNGYKCHVDWADGEIPISYIVTSASVHDSQVAIPLAAMSARRVQSFYDLMDQAYDAKAIHSYSRSLGHVPIIDLQRRRGDLREMAPAEKRRYCERTTAERGFSLLKEKFGGRDVRVRGYVKVMAHIGFCLLTLTADRLLNLLL